MVKDMVITYQFLELNNFKFVQNKLRNKKIKETKH